MPLPENSAAANLQLLQQFLTQHTNQQALLQQWQGTGNNHQLAICFTFPEEFKIDLKQVKQGTPYGERVMRLCESVNQPDTIKADIWTRSTNNGTLAGVRPGIPVEGEPIPPEEFLVQLSYTLISFVFPGPKFSGAKPFTGLKSIVESQSAFLGVPIITDPKVPLNQAFLLNPETLGKMGDAIDSGAFAQATNTATKPKKSVKKTVKPTLKKITEEQSDHKGE